MKKKGPKKISKRAIPGYTLIPNGDHYKVRKVGITAGQVKKDPRFEAFRRAGLDFAAAAQLSKLIREKGRKVIGKVNMSSRLTGLLTKAMQGDKQKEGGQRTVVNQTAATGKRIELNPATSFDEVFKGLCTAKLSKDKKTIKVHLPAHDPVLHLTPPPGITHYRWMCTLVTITGLEQVEIQPWQQTNLIPIKPRVVKSTTNTFAIGNEQEALHWVWVFIQWYKPAPPGAGSALLPTPGPLQLLEAVYSLSTNEA